MKVELDVFLYKKDKFKNRYTLGRICIVMIVVGLVIWGYTMPSNVPTYNPNPYEGVASGWSQILDDEKIQLENIQDFVQTGTEDSIVLERIVDAETVEKYLVFYAEHQEIQVTIDQEVVYEWKCQEELEFFGSPGKTWVSVLLTEEMLGATLQVSFDSNFEIFHDLPAEIYIVEEDEIILLQFQSFWLRNTVALLVIGLAIITYVNAILWEEPRKKHFLFIMADLYLFSALWLCSEVNILAIWSGRTSLSAILAMIFIRVIPVVFYHFILAMVSYRTIRTFVAGVILWMNLLGALLLQLVFRISLIRLIWVNIVAIIIASIVAIISIILHYRSRRRHTDYDYMLYWSVLLILAYGVECYNYINYNDNGYFMGMILMIAFAIYSIVVHVFFIRNQSRINIQKIQLEEEYNELHKKPLNQQINAHFLFNSLNTISAFCKSDPEKADLAVYELGKYMHNYTCLVGSNNYVSLEEELDLMEDYMAMQNLRFDNKIKYIVDNRSQDAMLPPLALQTLVENAINHGIRNQNYYGEIIIKAINKSDGIEISVIDNGVGFDMQEVRNTQGVGIKNLERRINAMGGIMIINSVKGMGTTVTLLLPFIDNNEGEE